MPETRYIVKIGENIAKYGERAILKGLEIDHIHPIPDQVAYWAFDNDLTDSINGYDFSVPVYPPIKFTSLPENCVAPYEEGAGGDLIYANGPSMNKSVKIQSYTFMYGWPLPPGMYAVREYKILRQTNVIQDILDVTADASVSISF